ncbi:MAG TPA: bifunctional 3-(3-hydroxy-phenyl)propionate/3-hydroxycinnamic acid hydroxylase [Caulobacteraceae bacterium]|nr:bifunctional 3-(3-hydroxy-phenyl)propionate/3-hydroxycinnamic acid hydroxylase [Caulobacteraceae bacterium]
MTEALARDVLIVGLGPVGATLAALLGDAGVDVIAIDRLVEVYPLPRAAHFDHEIMRVFQALGIADEVLRHARPATGYEFRSAEGEVLVSFGDMAAQLAPSGWAGGYMFNQPGLERALRAKLAAAPTVQVLLGAAFERLQVDDGGVRAEIAGPDGPLEVRARYLVGCDGAWSPVREAIGAGLDDLQFDEPWLVIDAIPRPGAQMPTINLQICDPARPTTCVLMGPGRHRWEFMMLPGETAEAVLEDAFIEGLLASWNVDVEIERKAVYRFHGLVADKWRAGPVLIAGDAAHQTPPFAGQGMCAGIRDAANLAWKLSAILAGRADDVLLDTYQIEREPNARAYIQVAIGMGRVVCTLDPAMAAARNAQMLATRASGARPLPPAAPPPMTGPGVLEGSPRAGELFPQPVAEGARLDDMLGPGAWLISAAPPTDAPDLTAIGLDDSRLTPFRPKLAGWLTANSAEAVLVRPDRIVFGAGAPAALTEAWSRVLRSPAHGS